MTHLLQGIVTNSDPFEPTVDEAEKIAREQLCATGPTASAVECLKNYVGMVQRRECPQLIKQYSALSGIEVGFGLITIPACQPGKGKTALCSQIAFDAIELDDELDVVFANAEMGFDALLRRQLTRIAGLNSKAVRFGNLDQQELERFERAAAELEPKLKRVSYLERPHNIMQLLRLDGRKPGLLVVDYLQKFAMPAKDARMGVGEVMSGLRTLANSGWAVLAISATTRLKEGEQLCMHHLRESSEVEYNADSIYLLNDHGATDGKEWLRTVTLSHAKNRHDSCSDIELLFHAPRMEFTARPTAEVASFKPVTPSKGLNPFKNVGSH